MPESGDTVTSGAPEASSAPVQAAGWSYHDEQPDVPHELDLRGCRVEEGWERLDRLEPSLVVVSSDVTGRHNLPDLIGSAVFLEYDQGPGRTVVLTRDTGTIQIEVPRPDRHMRRIFAFKDGPGDEVFPGQGADLPRTDWKRLLESRVHGPGH